MAPTLTAVTIISSNGNDNTLAKAGDTVTISITASESINQPPVTFTPNGQTAQGSAPSYSGATTGWSAVYTVDSNDPDGNMQFDIDFSDIAGNSGTTVTSTTNASAVSVDNTPPTISAITTSDFSWGAYLNKAESEDAAGGDVTVQTSGAEDGQTLTITLNSVDYTASVASDSASVPITQAGLGLSLIHI